MDFFSYSLEKNQSNIQIQIYLFKIMSFYILFYWPCRRIVLESVFLMSLSKTVSFICLQQCCNRRDIKQATIFLIIETLWLAKHGLTWSSREEKIVGFFECKVLRTFVDILLIMFFSFKIPPLLITSFKNELVNFTTILID